MDAISQERDLLYQRLLLRITNFVRGPKAPIRFYGGEAEDVAQEAMLRLWSKYPNLERVEDLDPVSIRIAINVSFEEARKRSRYQGADPPDGGWERVLRDPDPGSEDKLVADERFTSLHRAVDQLSPVCREVMKLQMAGNTNPEIAKALGIESGNLLTRLCRCRQTLRALLERKQNHVR